jgi:hypothetical protein
MVKVMNQIFKDCRKKSESFRLKERMIYEEDIDDEKDGNDDLLIDLFKKYPIRYQSFLWDSTGVSFFYIKCLTRLFRTESQHYLHLLIVLLSES